MKDKVFLRIEKEGVNAEYYQQVAELCLKLGLTPTKAILFSIVYVNQFLDEKEAKNAARTIR